MKLPRTKRNYKMEVSTKDQNYNWTKSYQDKTF